MFVHINNRNDVRNHNETMMKRYIKQRVKHKMKLYLMRVSVRQVEEQHSETKRSMKPKRKKVVTLRRLQQWDNDYRVIHSAGPM